MYLPDGREPAPPIRKPWNALWNSGNPSIWNPMKPVHLMAQGRQAVDGGMVFIRIRNEFGKRVLKSTFSVEYRRPVLSRTNDDTL